MKKFISMVMAAAMVVSLVPATAFAANAATFKVVGAAEITEKDAEGYVDGAFAGIAPKAEVQIKLTEVDTKFATSDTYDVTLSFDNAEAKADKATVPAVTVKTLDGAKTGALTLDGTVEKEDDSFDFVLAMDNLEDGDVLVINADAVATALGLIYTDDADATVEVDGDFGASDALTLISVLEEGLKVTLKKVGEVAEEESKELKSDLVLEANVNKIKAGQVVELKLNSGFEWEVVASSFESMTLNTTESEDDCLVFDVTADDAKITIGKNDLKIDAVDAKVGDVAKITVKVKEGSVDSWKDTVTVDAMEVIGETVTMSVDEDEDVPVMYSGVKPGTAYINAESDDFMSLEVTIEESVAGAMDVKKDLELMLPEGVFVTDVVADAKAAVDVVVPTANIPATASNNLEKAFAAAYEEGKHEGFVFDRKTFTDTTLVGTGKTAMEFTFKLELMAVPGFVGDVVLTMDGPAFEEAQEVTIAKFVAPYTVEAAQNDLIIDYRNTEVPTDVVVKEAEAGLWNDGKMNFVFGVGHMEFEDDAVITVNEESEMEVDAVGAMGFIVDEESDEEAAVVTFSGIELYMERNLPAGAYDLKLGTKAGEEMMTTALFTTEDEGALVDKKFYPADVADWKTNDAKDAFIPESGTVKEAWINIITAGRDQDDASFTKKVVVTIGADTMVAGESTVALDVPAYINAAGRTMLPVRAVAVALGINTNNVIWDQATKTVTILYGQRIITMQVGSSVITVNGSEIPATAAVEIVNGRTFLGFRDLATALGVTDIVWTAETQQVTMNGGN